MAGGVHDIGHHRADGVGIAVAEEPVELGAVALELGAFVEDLAEGVLNDRDVLADAQFAAELLLDVGCAGQVVGMQVSQRVRENDAVMKVAR